MKINKETIKANKRTIIKTGLVVVGSFIGAIVLGLMLSSANQEEVTDTEAVEVESIEESTEQVETVDNI